MSDPEHGSPDLPGSRASRRDAWLDRPRVRDGGEPARAGPGGGGSSGGGTDWPADDAGRGHSTRDARTGGQDRDPKASTGRRIVVPGSRSDRSGRGGRGSFLRELPVLVLIAFLLALLIKALLVQAFWIPSESMERTLLIDDRVLVNKVVYHFRDVHRGEVVVFNGDGTGFENRESVIAPPSNVFSRFVRGAQHLLGLGAPSDKDFIKRVIGVGGDTVACCADGRVTVNGRPLDEPYVFQNDYQKFGPVKVPAGQLWVMGDHRGESSDSRQNGTIPQDAVIGRAFVRVWPFSRIGFLPVPDIFAGLPSALGPATGPLTAAAVVGLPALALRRRRRGPQLLPALVPDRPGRRTLRGPAPRRPGGRGRPPGAPPVASSGAGGPRFPGATIARRCLRRRAAGGASSSSSPSPPVR